MDEDTPTEEPTRAVAIIADAPSAVAAHEALKTYRAIQKVFDEDMPEAIMEIGGKKFRKKVYWRAIATAFHLSCELRIIERIEAGAIDIGGVVKADWGYDATVRATAPDGRISDGDGSCMASEKWTLRPECPSCGSSASAFRSKKGDAKEFYCWRKKGGCGAEWDGGPNASMGVDDSQATLHNIRSHAITRAKNRAISDLVGFGEVSADELPPQDRGFGNVVDRATGDDSPPPSNENSASDDVPRSSSQGSTGSSDDATAGQLKLIGAKSNAQAAVLMSIAEEEGISLEEFTTQTKVKDEIRRLAKERVGCGEVIQKKEVDPLLVAIAAAMVTKEGGFQIIPSVS